MTCTAGKDQSHERWNCGFEPPGNDETRCNHKRQTSVVCHAGGFSLVSLCGTWTSLGAAQRCMDLVCTSFGVPPTCTEAMRMTMRPIVKFWWPPDASSLMCRLPCCGFFARLVRSGTAPLFAVLQAGDGHVSSWTTALRRDLAWLYKMEAWGVFYDFSDPHNGNCSDWVAFARDKPAQ